MNDRLSIDPKTSALLIMDFQRTVVENHARDKEGILARTRGLIGSARRVALKVVYVVVGFRPGYPEVSPRNQSFGMIRNTGRFAHGAAGGEIHPEVAPEAQEVVVTKHRTSAFSGTDLDMVLRANSLDTLILAGIATSGVVLSTVRYAADLDYRLFVVADCCSDSDPEVHRVLTEKVFPRQATVTTAALLGQVLL